MTSHQDKDNLQRTADLYPDGGYRREQTLSGLVFSKDTVMGSRNNEISGTVTLSVVSFQSIYRNYLGYYNKFSNI